MKFAYADPPYLGMCARYEHNHPDGRCWDDVETHRLLIERLGDYDGWALSLHVPSLRAILNLCPDDVRVLAWVKTWCSWKPGAHPKAAWEPLIIRGSRKPLRSHRVDPVDWIAAPSSTLKFLGAKPEKVVWWMLDCLGVTADDDFDDLFHGSGAVTRAWQSWRGQTSLFLPDNVHQTVHQDPLFEESA